MPVMDMVQLFLQLVQTVIGLLTLIKQEKK